jgi:hypothetical protein
MLKRIIEKVRKSLGKGQKELPKDYRERRMNGDHHLAVAVIDDKLVVAGGVHPDSQDVV